MCQLINIYHVIDNLFQTTTKKNIENQKNSIQTKE